MSRPSPFIIIFILAALLGLSFSIVSVTSFAEFLDRELHQLGCGYIPGVAGDASTQAGCKATMMSPYSSVFRNNLWGGIPIALPAIGLFGFMMFRGIDLLTRQGQERRDSAQWLFFVSIIPVVTSIIMGFIALAKLETTCATCIGIYFASFLACGMAFGAWRDEENQQLLGGGQHNYQGHQLDAHGHPIDDTPYPSQNFQSNEFLLPIFLAQFVLFLIVPVLVYVLAAPDHTARVEACGSLPHPEDPHSVMVDLDDHRGDPAIEIFDPLCKTCRAFETRLEDSGWGERLDRKAVMFPLDAECNWMLSSSVHPGACTISEAMLCAQMTAAVKPSAVKHWAFLKQDEILEQSKGNPAAARKMVLGQFPQLGSCIGGREVRTKLNKSLRWAVANKLPVVTPQLYVRGRRLCEEDIDLGLDFAMGRLTGGSL